ncbi:MAG: HAD-IIB family hydrolase [Propioniciclava sp.]
MRLIATDLDGTLLGPDGRIGAHNLAALGAAHARGVQVVIATGRPARWLDCLQPLAELRPLVLASNGAVEIDLATGGVVRQHCLSTQQVQAVAADLRAAFPEISFALEQGFDFGCEPGWLEQTDASMVPEAVSGPALGIPWEDLLAQVRPVVKLLALSTVRPVEHLAAEASEIVGERAMVTHSAASASGALLELSAPGISKASALAAICSRIGVDSSEVVAFGDMPNDLAMLTYAGQGFAMANAHDDLKQRFPVIGSAADGGVGDTVRRLLAQA